MADQDQFLDVIDRDEAERRFRAALNVRPIGSEQISVRESLGRVLAGNILAAVDVPGFDRSNFDGYALRAVDSAGATELRPRILDLLPHSLEAGIEPKFELHPGQAVPISTGGMLPRGADAVVMVEHTDEEPGRVIVRRSVTPGFGVSFAGTDIAIGETVLRVGTLLTSRETGVLAALGVTQVEVWRRPRVTIISTGNEIIAPGELMRAAGVYDSNSQVLGDAVREQGGVPDFGGIVRDDENALRAGLQTALRSSDLVLLSGGTSKGRGDLCYRVVAELNDPGIVVHGVALKPGKPICMAVTQGKAVVILPGFPTSAVFTFHEFVAPVIRMMAGLPPAPQQTLNATLAVRVNSEIGRTEYLLVGLVSAQKGLAAFPMGKGSGSVTTFSRADGFVTIARHTEIIEAGTEVVVQLTGRNHQPADLVVIGSHCTGLDYLLTELQRRGITSKLLTTGSSAGLMAAKRGECDVAGIHLLDSDSGLYNTPFLNESVTLIPGYMRSQGVLFRRQDTRFRGRSCQQIADLVSSDSSVIMVNRNQGSGTRILIDRLLNGTTPAGYEVQPGNHSAVAASIVQGRADWGVAIESIACRNNLTFLPIQEEHFDFVVPQERQQRPAVRAFVELLAEESVQLELERMGFKVKPREAGTLSNSTM